jgi:hypothetical protein
LPDKTQQFGVLLLFISLMLPGCSPITVDRNTESPVPVQLRVDDAAYWLEEWLRTLQLPPEQYQQVLDARSTDFANNPGPRSRLRLAMLLAVGKPSGLDREQALKLVRGMETETATKSAKALAALLEIVISQQLLVEKTEGSQQMDLKKELTAAKRRIQELERQLHDLTTIEQNIQDRTKQ